METSTTSRESILAAIRQNLPQPRVSRPDIPVYPGPERPLRLVFEERLVKAGAAAHPVGSAADAAAKLAALHPAAKVVCSAVPEISGTRRAEDVHDPHALADVDVGVMRAQFGVAESGAVWLTQEDLIVTALGVLPQHLVVLLDPDEIVSDMHEAYRRAQLRETAYGCFMAGPSATADIEATLVQGAPGARSLNVLFLPRTSLRRQEADHDTAR
jgi:L-lactate dehydrogenase complex protein LldG